MYWRDVVCSEREIRINFQNFNQFLISALITARVRSTREGNVLTSVCPSIHPSVCPQGGVPISHNALQHFPGMPWGSRPQTPPPPGGTRTPPGGYPDPPRGVPRPPQGGYPDPPWGGTQTPPGVPGPPPGGGTRGGTRGDPGPPLPARTEGVRTTRWTVCLLRSRRRTFLFLCFFAWNKY